MFATLLKKIIASVGGYGQTVGHLAMALGAVHLHFHLSLLLYNYFFQLEHAFEVISDSLVSPDKADDVNKKKVPQFNNHLWGTKVPKWVLSTKNLDMNKHWPTILQVATLRVSDWNVDEMDGDEDLLEDDPQATIVICEFNSVSHYADHTYYKLCHQ